jgi:hypothetical protein
MDIARNIAICLLISFDRRAGQYDFNPELLHRRPEVPAIKSKTMVAIWQNEAKLCSILQRSHRMTTEVRGRDVFAAPPRFNFMKAMGLMRRRTNGRRR